jgi:LuxR family maltose regulon positive regulatory protein
MNMRSEFSTMAEWCAAFPDEVMRTRPGLCLFQSNALVLGNRRENLDKIEQRLRQVEKAGETAEDRQMGRLLIAQAAATRTVLAAMTRDPAADPREQFPLAQRTLDLLSEDDPARSAVTLTIGYAHMALHDVEAASETMKEAGRLSLACHHYFGIVEAAFHQARLAHSRGELRRAAEICRQGQVDIAAILAHTGLEIPAAGGLDIAMGCVLLEQDNLEEAERLISRGLDWVWGMNPYYQMIASVGLFRLREIQTRPAEALEFLARLEETWPDLAFCARALRVEHSLRSAADNPLSLAEAAAWCRSFSASFGLSLPSPGMGPFGAAEACYIACLAWIRAQIATGNAATSKPYLDRQLALAEAHKLANRVIELSLLEAQAWEAQGDDTRVEESLEHALAAAEPEGYVRIFDQGTALTRLLVKTADRGIARESIRRILAVIGAPAAVDREREGSAVSSAGIPTLESGEHLSQREIAVLRLMAQGASNQEIAKQLVITVGTVKSHVNHILTKLDAKNRTEAVARARGMGLLEI